MARVLLLGGLDPSGGAGVTVDATVAALHGAHPLPVIVAWTVQDRRAFRSAEPVPAAQWRAALAAVLDDGPVHAVKVGFVADAATLYAVADALAPLRGRAPIVLDPVLAATVGGYRPEPALVGAYVDVLATMAPVLVPNQPELDALCGGDPGRALANGAVAVLAKGGHADGDDAVDVLWHGGRRVEFRRRRLPVGRVRGTGCALASAIAARLAGGADLVAACRGGGDWLARVLAALGPAAADDLPRLLPFARALPDV